MLHGSAITIDAVTPQGAADNFIAWGAAAAGGEGDVAVAGSVGINVIQTFNTQASADAGSKLVSTGAIAVTASAPLDIQTVAAGVSFVGVSGAVAVTLLNITTAAVIGGGAKINQADPAAANLQQAVSVDAGDNASVQTFVVGVAGGFVGVSGAIDIGTLNSNIKAEVQAGAIVPAAGDIGVHAVGLQSLTGLTASGAGGFIGVGGAVSDWSVGTQLLHTYSDSGGNSANPTQGSDGTGADSNAAGQAQTGTGQVASNLGSFDHGGSNRNTSRARISDANQTASTAITAQAPTQASLTATEDQNPVPPGTSACDPGRRQRDGWRQHQRYRA